MYTHHRLNTTILALAVAACAAIAGCGQKGPLYLHSDDTDAYVEALKEQQEQTTATEIGPDPETEPGSLIPSPNPQ